MNFCSRLTAIAAGACFLIGANPLSNARAADADTIVYAAHYSLVPRWLDPSEFDAQYTGYIASIALYDALLEQTADDPFAPSLAESWSMSEDGLTYEFKLRPGATFHNGDPVTSEDVKFTLEHYNVPATAPIKARVKEVQTPSPDVVRIVLNEVWPDFLTYYCGLVTSSCYILPKKYFEEVGAEGFAKHPIGAGPYKFVSLNPGVELVMEAYDGYWGKKPETKRIVMKSVPEMATRAAMLKSGEADIAYVIGGVLAEEIKNTEGFSLGVTNPPSTIWLTMTEQFDPNSPWSDLRVRQAASLAMDREGMNDAVYLGYGKAISNVVPDNFQYFWQPPAIERDLEKAKALMAEAGYPNGFDGGNVYVFQSYTDQAEIAANDLAAIGIRTTVVPMERATFFAQWLDQSLKGIILTAVGTFGNAATFLEDFVSTNGKYTYQTYTKIAELFEQQSRETDQTKRAQLLEEVQRAIYDEMMFIPLVQLAGISGIGPRVENAAIGDIPVWFISAPYEDVKLKP